MAALGEPRARRLGNTRFGVEEAVAIHAHPRLLDCLLDIEAEVEHVQEHLRLRLEDAVRAGRAHAQREGAVLEDLDGRHHGAGLASRLDHVGRGRIEVHPLEDVVENESRAGHGESRAKGHA